MLMMMLMLMNFRSSNVILSGVKRDSSGKVMEAKAMMTVYILEGHANITSTEGYRVGLDRVLCLGAGLYRG